MEETGLRTNTLIAFSSDNGGPSPGAVTDNGPLRAGKGTIYEGGIRVCAFANWPGHIAAGQRIQEPLHIADWYPTWVKLAGGSLEQPLPVDGCDILPLLVKGERPPRDALLLPGGGPYGAAIRMGDWKLLARGSGAPMELYNLAEDRGERRNRADAEPAKRDEMRARLDAHLRDAAPFSGGAAAARTKR